MGMSIFGKIDETGTQVHTVGAFGHKGTHCTDTSHEKAIIGTKFWKKHFPFYQAPWFSLNMLSTNLIRTPGAQANELLNRNPYCRCTIVERAPSWREERRGNVQVTGLLHGRARTKYAAYCNVAQIPGCNVFGVKRYSSITQDSVHCVQSLHK